MTKDLTEVLLRGADPVAGRLDGVDPAGPLLAEVVASPAGRSRWRGRRVVVAGLAALVVAVPGAAYAANRIFHAETGTYGLPGFTENDTTQYIDLCADDLDAYLRSLPVPAAAPPRGWSWERVADATAAGIRRGTAADCPSPGSTMQETGLRSTIEFYAQAIWLRAALAAHAAGDEGTARADLRAAAASMERLDLLGVYADDGWRPVHDGLLAGDWALVAQWVEANAPQETRP